MKIVKSILLHIGLTIFYLILALAIIYLYMCASDCDYAIATHTRTSQYNYLFPYHPDQP